MPLTLQKVFAERSKMRTKTPNTAFLGVKKVIALPVANFLAVRAEFGVLTGEKGRPNYDTVIAFQNLSVVDEQDMLHDLRVDIAPGMTSWLQRPSFTQTDIKVTCTCADFYWTWWYFINTKGALAGSAFPAPYQVTGHPVRVTDGGAYGSPLQQHGVGTEGRWGYSSIPRNPNQLPGCCKHIVELGKFLIQKKWITYGTSYNSGADRRDRQQRQVSNSPRGSYYGGSV